LAEKSELPSLQLTTFLPQHELCYASKQQRTIVSFSMEVLAHFQAHRQTGKATSEVGGQLFADIAGNEVRVVRATGPNTTDKRGWAWFNPDRRKQNSEIKQMFESGLHFVGDWHTHPEETPTPSSLDLESMADCFRKSRHQLAAFLMVIVGRAEFPDGLWVSLHNSSKRERLELVRFQGSPDAAQSNSLVAKQK
jgi:integrative and conjugative element protein (TIGR02256 family)